MTKTSFWGLMSHKIFFITVLLAFIALIFGLSPLIAVVSAAALFLVAMILRHTSTNMIANSAMTDLGRRGSTYDISARSMNYEFYSKADAVWHRPADLIRREIDTVITWAKTAVRGTGRPMAAAT